VGTAFLRKPISTPASELLTLMVRLSMPKTLVAAFSCLVMLLLVGPLPADQEDLNSELMRATVKIGHDKSNGTGFFLCRPDPRDPQRNQFVLVTAAHVFENIPGDEATLYLRNWIATPLGVVVLHSA